MSFVPVIIVGGGVAGLAAAKTLANQVDFVLIEAQNYLGGRILTIDATPNLTIDLGAQYIHGNQNNSVHDICEELQMILSENENTAGDEDFVKTAQGETIESDLWQKATDLWNDVREKAQQASEAVSFADVVPRDFQDQSSTEISSELIDQATDYFLKSEMAETGCSTTKDLNLIAYGTFEDLKGDYEVDLKNGGYRPFINYLKSFLPNENSIRLNSEVIRVQFNENDGKLIVEFNGKHRKEILTCDHIIWTTSLGHLKANFHRIFAQIPELIQQKENAIANLGFGTVNKVVLIYKEKFWSDNASSFSLLKTNDGRSRFEMSQILKEKLQNERIDSKTYEEIVRMIFRYDVLPSTTLPVLTCWFAGQPAILTEKLSEDLLGQICHEILCSYLQIPWQNGRLTRVVRSNWNSNPFIRGAYTYYSMKSSLDDGEQLRKGFAPDGIPRILFAGEATHQGYYSTVNAALETGIAVGQEILSQLK